MIKEHRAEQILKAWLTKKKLTVRKGVNVDVEAGTKTRLTWVIEVKGDHRNLSGENEGDANAGALRNGFLTGLGQALVARNRHRNIKVSLGLTRQYTELVDKYSDVLGRSRISVVWIMRGKVWEERPGANSSAFRERGTGHPDGNFACGVARFQVVDGELSKVRIQAETAPKIDNFSKLCGALRIPHSGDSAARVLARYSTRTKKAA